MINSLGPQTKWKRKDEEEKENLLSSKSFFFFGLKKKKDNNNYVGGRLFLIVCLLLCANPSLCLIIQNLSISSAVLPGILPAISPHLIFKKS